MTITRSNERKILLMVKLLVVAIPIKHVGVEMESKGSQNEIHNIHKYYNYLYIFYT